tara:strand:- start:278 stop:1033 length:756 start_codon:yes stop_codon:yes gene_type:complete
MRDYGDQIVEDCSDRLFSLMGQAMHHVLERGGDVDGKRMIERRLYANVEGWTLSGQVDLWEDNILSDYKFTSVWETMNGLKEEKVQQLNVLAWLCNQNNIPVDEVQIVALYRDYSKSKARFERDYPQHQIGILKADLWDEDEQREFIEEKIREHQDAREWLPLCTSAEMWERPTKWAVMKQGRKSALRLLDSKQQALEYCVSKNLMNDNDELKADHYLEMRTGEKVRCENYCAVAPFCNQFQKSKEEAINY